ncbi:MAG: peptidylprolyl isomerase [Sphingomicrobium sp.]
MLVRIAMMISALGFAAPAFAQTPDSPAQAAAPAPKEDLVPVTLNTSLGRIVVAVDRLHAPITTGNFLRYVDSHRLDGETFYRALRISGGDGGLIQGGVRSDTRKLFPPIAHEPTSRTGLHNVARSIVMARLEPGSARADFFILASDTPSYDSGAPDGDPDGFAVFGHVVEGMDVVRKILAAPTSPTLGEGVMKGQMLDPPVKITKAERVK